jgi:hypothetical protein
MEIWKKIKDFENYEISSLGKVRNKKGNILVPKYDRDGYAYARISKNGHRYLRAIHRLVAIAFIENPESKPTVNHIDGVKHNNVVPNLEWATHSEQALHSRNILNNRSIGNPEKIRNFWAGKRGNESCAGKEYVLISPEGKSIKITSINYFCEGKDLSPNALYKVAAGKQKTHRGWRCRKAS